MTDVSTPSAPIRSFNRYELKYVVDLARMARLRSDLSALMVPDNQGDNGTYPVWSVYYDSRGLRAYWEKVDGQRFRRKIRIRHYGTPAELHDDTTVFVEIKQRVDRVTQKRRVLVTYAEARQLCDQRVLPAGVAGDPVAQEVLGLLVANDLRPVTLVGYRRAAFVGVGPDRGLRVTFDRDVRGRDRGLGLHEDADNRSFLSPHLLVVEIKVDDRVPTWLTAMIASHDMSRVTLSKYCRSIDAFGQAPRSIFHAPSFTAPATQE